MLIEARAKGKDIRDTVSKLTLGAEHELEQQVLWSLRNLLTAGKIRIDTKGNLVIIDRGKGKRIYDANIVPKHAV